MADSGKTKTPGSNVKKVQEGSSKKRRKHKKSVETTGDGAPSPSSVANSASQNSTATSLQQSFPEGAAADIKGDEKPECNSAGKNVVIGDGRMLQVNETGGKSAPNEISKQKTADKEVLSHDSKEECDSKAFEKHLAKKETKANKQQKPNSTKQEVYVSKIPAPSTGEIKMKKDSDILVTLTLKHDESDDKNREISSMKSHVQSGKDNKSNETLNGGEQQQKNTSHKKSEKLQSNKTDSDPGQKLKTQTKEAVKGAGVVEGQHKPRNKVETQPDIVDGQHKPRNKVETKSEAVDGQQKSKAQLRAERRAIQEAQRAAKDVKKNEAPVISSVGAANSTTNVSAGRKEPAGDKSKSTVDKSKSAVDKSKSTVEKSKSAVDKSKSNGEVIGGEKNSKKKLPANTIAHNETEEEMWARREKEILCKKSDKIDSSVMNLGFQYFHHNIVGANARCVALLATLREVISKYRTPDERELSRDLEKNFLTPCISYINYCRPISTSMGNAIKHLKHHISKIPRDMDDDTAICKLHEEIDNFIQVNIIKASEAVAHHAKTKIDNGDVILIYAASSLIGQVLRTAYKEGKKFRVIVVEGRPRSEGKSMLRYLVRCGIPCSYIYIGSASHAMNEATKVFLGAAAMFAIGDMYSRSGNSMIAALAKANNIPVLVCCETYKFTDKVQLHTGDSNLHTRGKDLVSIGHKNPILTSWEDIGLRLLNLMYDVTGSEYITAVVTELGMLPCTSVPVVLRRQEDLY